MRFLLVNEQKEPCVSIQLTLSQGTNHSFDLSQHSPIFGLQKGLRPEICGFQCGLAPWITSGIISL